MLPMRELHYFIVVSDFVLFGICLDPLLCFCFLPGRTYQDSILDLMVAGS